ncbi:MAG TPA: transglycosylase SLT domain-containing protein [Ktedonobacterales bacterium]
MTQRHDPDQRFAGGASGQDAPTQAQPTHHTRRTLGIATKFSTSVSGARGRRSSPPPVTGEVTDAPTHALQSAPAQDARALIEAGKATAAEKPVVIHGGSMLKLPARHVVPRRSGPRSVVAQFMVAMIATAMVAGVLALSTPLGEAASLSAGGGLAAVSGSVPWIPTATPTAKPKPTYRPPIGANPGQQAVINEIVAVFGSAYSPGALAVAKCESGYDPNAWNSYPIMGSHASGVFQILYPSTWNSTAYSTSSPFDANANIHAAYQIFHRDGNSWREWQCKP